MFSKSWLTYVVQFADLCQYSSDFVPVLWLFAQWVATQPDNLHHNYIHSVVVFTLFRSTM